MSRLIAQSISSTVSRAIYITDGSILGEDEELTLLRLPRTLSESDAVTVIELTKSAGACPKEMFVVQMTCVGSGDPKADFRAAEEKLFQPTDPSGAGEEDVRPKVLWSLYFSRQNFSHVDQSPADVANVFITTGPDETFHFEDAVKQTKPIFDKICPDEEFLPKAPNPEDIIFDGAEGQGSDAGFGNASNQDEEKEGETKTEGKTDENDTTHSTAADDPVGEDGNVADCTETKTGNHDSVDAETTQT